MVVKSYILYEHKAVTTFLSLIYTLSITIYSLRKRLRHMNEMIESEYLESAEGSNYWLHLKSAKNTWSYLKSAGDSNSCGQNNLRLCLNSAESGDSARQNNNRLWPAQQLY
ncbi:hypothetical protein F8M41_012839 [Gigaspora margarita]|uniref:Uncharacterized protein n=1 Tax=Gigaspora margarita TaxID=4874 RepID=A0A8H3X0G9_GIGMA|nr:hypothetical protein F8M41_012839 [Gigaspora margarita]